MALKICINAIGKISEREILSLMQDYTKRIKWDFKVNEFNNSQNSSSDVAKAQEAQLLWSKCELSDFVIAMDERGQELTSVEFAELLKDLERNGAGRVTFLIGGADGHADETRKKANKILSLSKMTMPHKIARLILVEQIYRAFSIAQNHPYHRV